MCAAYQSSPCADYIDELRLDYIVRYNKYKEGRIAAILRCGINITAAIEAIDAALAQPDAQAVAWMDPKAVFEDRAFSFETEPGWVALCRCAEQTLAQPDAPEMLPDVVAAERVRCAQMCHETMMELRNGHPDDSWDDHYNGMADGAEMCRDKLKAIASPRSGL